MNGLQALQGTKGFFMEAKAKLVLEADPSSKLEIRNRRLKNSCQEFSSVLISYMMKTMREGSSWGDDSGCASGMYQDMLSQQVAKVIARSSDLGIADMLYTQLDNSTKTKAPQKPADTRAESQTAVSPPHPDKAESGGGGPDRVSVSEFTGSRVLPADGIRQLKSASALNLFLNNIKNSAD